MELPIYRRDAYLGRIRPFFDTAPVKVLVGMRRCGKSTLLGMIAAELATGPRKPENIVCIDLESRRGPTFQNERELYTYLVRWAGERQGRVYILLDEIQNLDGWERCIRALLTDIDADIYLTGSNSRLMSGELATHLAGRYVEFTVRPFSFRELTDIARTNGWSQSQSELFELFLRYGSMPLIAASRYDTDTSLSILSAMYDSVVIHDIAERNHLRNTTNLNEILRYAASEIGHSMSSDNIADYLGGQKRKATPSTVLSYLGYAEDAMLLRKVLRQDLRGREVLKTDYKYYLTDLGLRSALGFSNTESIDQALENIVCNELIDRGFEVTVGRGNGCEVDFVADRAQQREYYQVSYLMATDSTVEREFGTLARIKDNYPKYVLSLDTVDRSRGGIIHRNLLEWLLDR